MKPIDEKIKHLLKEFEIIFTIEEHSITGGLGTIISEIITENNFSIKHKKIALPNKFLKSGTYDQLLDRYLLSSQKIYKRFSMNI